MATSTPLPNSAALAPPSVQRNHLVSALAQWHLLSLDAPSVAVLWTCFAARASRIPLPPSFPFAMFFAVWLLYAADRLLDTRDAAPHLQRQLEERHYFHRSHKHAFRAGIVLASLALASLLPHLPTAFLQLYAMLGALLFAYFVLIHSAALPRSFGLAKEFAVGIFFSAAIFVPTIVGRPDLGFSLLPIAILFAAVCCLNCLFIRLWEQPQDPQTYPATNARSRPVAVVAFIALLAGAALALLDRSLPGQLPLACALAAALLLLLHSQRSRLARNTLRAAADLCLLSPLVFMHLLGR